MMPSVEMEEMARMAVMFAPKSVPCVDVSMIHFANWSPPVTARPMTATAIVFTTTRVNSARPRSFAADCRRSHTSLTPPMIIDRTASRPVNHAS